MVCLEHLLSVSNKFKTAQSQNIFGGDITSRCGGTGCTRDRKSSLGHTSSSMWVSGALSAFVAKTKTKTQLSKKELHTRNKLLDLRRSRGVPEKHQVQGQHSALQLTEQSRVPLQRRQGCQSPMATMPPCLFLATCKAPSYPPGALPPTKLWNHPLPPQ